jgi:hypothetical protein
MFVFLQISVFCGLLFAGKKCSAQNRLHSSAPNMLFCRAQLQDLFRLPRRADTGRLNSYLQICG